MICIASASTQCMMLAFAGLEQEHAEVEHLQADLRAVQEKRDALPEEIQKFKTVLDEDTTALQRQESGAFYTLIVSRLYMRSRLEWRGHQTLWNCSAGGQGVPSREQVAVFEAGTGSLQGTLGSGLSQRCRLPPTTMLSFQRPASKGPLTQQQLFVSCRKASWRITTRLHSH
jgi:hypothetical protein